MKNFRTAIRKKIKYKNCHGVINILLCTVIFKCRVAGAFLIPFLINHWLLMFKHYFVIVFAMHSKFVGGAEVCPLDISCQSFSEPFFTTHEFVHQQVKNVPP